jgi:hypothetical protein
MPEKAIQDLVFRNVRFVSGGGGERGPVQTLPDLMPERLQGVWPEYTSFGMSVPCYGLYAGHVNGLTIDGCAFEPFEKDDRPAVICDDVRRSRISGNVTDDGTVGVVLDGEAL